MQLIKISGMLSPFNAIGPNASKSITESIRWHRIIIGIGWRVIVLLLGIQMYAYASNSAGNASCCEKCFAPI